MQDAWDVRPAGKGTALTPDEIRVRALWRGPYIVAISPEDAAQQLAALKRKWTGE